MDALGPLRTLREAENLSVAVIDAQDLYDEYNFGQKSPHAIRDFFLEARRWERAPRYAVLVGDATFDPKNFTGRGGFDFVPTKMLDTRAFETASDDWFTDFDGDRVADVPIGRLPVRTLAEANTVVSKLVAYARAEGGEWSGSALLVADNADNFDFAAASRALGSRLPAGVSARYVTLNPAAAGQSRSELLDALNGGQLLVNYTGHGGPDVWAQENLLNTAGALGLKNADRLPFVTALSCMNGLFHDVFGDSLAESLLKAPDGGAIAVWSSSGLTAAQFQLEAGTALYDALFRPNTRLGDAVRTAKSAASDPDVRATWNLIGDPATRLRQGGR
jgi:hypothetical protein